MGSILSSVILEKMKRKTLRAMIFQNRGIQGRVSISVRAPENSDQQTVPESSCHEWEPKENTGGTFCRQWGHTAPSLVWIPVPLRSVWDKPCWRPKCPGALAAFSCLIYFGWNGSCRRGKPLIFADNTSGVLINISLLAFGTEVTWRMCSGEMKHPQQGSHNTALWSQ